MSKTLIIAEKPSVAQDISRALGGFERHDGYFENEQYVLSSSVGHLLTLFNPDDVVRGKWSFAHLPAIPKNGFDIQPADKKSLERLKLLVKLLKRKDVSAIINACDAGREGELIFRYIIQYAKVHKPIQRLWLQSMTKQAILEAFDNLRSDESMKPLEAAARSRAEADWLVGINGTRAMTAFNSKDGGFFKTPIGRVQTPTLAIVYDREQRIRQFVSKDYWEVIASFVSAAGIYEGRWIDKDFKKDLNDPEKKESRLWSETVAQTVVMACRNKPGEVSEESKPLTQNSPALYDLTSLQREANSRFGFSAKTTLALAQALYERHKVITYPRTDSRYLPEDYINTVKQTLGEIAQSSSLVNHSHSPFAQTILNQSWVKPNRRIFDNKKVSDHFAIIPTAQLPKELSDAEAKIYDLITKRFMAIFYPAAEYRVTTRITIVSGHHFKTEGKVLVSPGWLAVYGKGVQDGEDSLVPISENEQVKTEEVHIEAHATKPPPHYTEATLLSAMEGAGKLVEDDELREAMSERGLGTPATRATIIEGLIADQYLRREGRDLVATTKTRQLMTLLNGLNIKELTSPELTGEWENKLKQIEQGTLDRQRFMQEIAQSTQVIVKRAKEYEHDTIPGDYVTLKTPCPVCAGVVKENYRRFACVECDFSITKNPGGRNLETEEAETLLAQGMIGPLSGFISKLGRPFNAILRLNNEHKLAFDFGQNEESDQEDIDFASLQAIGKCPKCENGHIFDIGMNYICDQSTNKDAPCDFKSGKVILQQEISQEQMQKLLANGKTDLLEGFVSNRTNRKFKAFLVLEKKGKIAFEFEERGSATSKTTTKRASKSASVSKAATKQTSTTTKRAVKKVATKRASNNT